MNAAWTQSIPILTGAASRGALAVTIKLFALFSAIILLSFFVMVDFSTAAPPQKSAVRAPAAQSAAANSSIAEKGKGMASSMKVERYVFENGMVRDIKTGMMWAANDNGSPINWVGAKTYCENYHGGGYSGWRMPSTVELAALDAGGALKDKIKMSVCVGHLCNVWASETNGSESAFYAFNGGGVVWYTQSASNLWRALPVRNAK